MSDSLRIVRYDGPREPLRWLFMVAEDSAELLDGYLHDGDLLIAMLDGEPVGLSQITGTGNDDELEINVLAVAVEHQRGGIGRALVDASFEWARDRGRSRMLVATGAADVGNLRFYQRCGFRLLRIERDAFTPAAGYHEPIMVDGIRLWDRVWFDADLTGPSPTLDPGSSASAVNDDC